MPNKKPGSTAQLYRTTGATWESFIPSALKVRDLKFCDVPSGMFGSGDRTSEFESFIPTRTKFRIEFEYVHDSSDTGLMALFAAATFDRATPIELLATDDNISTGGTRGIRFMATIESGLEIDAKLTDGQAVKMVAVPSGHYVYPPTRWLSSGGGGGSGTSVAITFSEWWGSPTYPLVGEILRLVGTGFSFVVANNVISFNKGFTGVATEVYMNGNNLCIAIQVTGSPVGQTGDLTVQINNENGTSNTETWLTIP